MHASMRFASSRQTAACWRFRTGSSQFSTEHWRSVLPNTLEPEELSGAVTLVVVDMQPGFIASTRPATLAAVVYQVKLAISRGWAVVLLEVNPWRHGPTHSQITDCLEGYSCMMMRVKSGDCGAAQVVEACEDFWYPMGFFRVCGVNTDACVKSTVLGLQARLPGSGIRVIRQACNSDTPGGGHWQGFPAGPSQAPNVVVSSQSIGPEFPGEGGSREQG